MGATLRSAEPHADWCPIEATAFGEAGAVAVQAVVRRGVLGLFERRALIDPQALADMRQRAHGGGFSLDATIRIEACDRAGLERLRRYCARPVFPGETRAFGTRSALKFSVDSLIGSLIGSKYSARILSTSKKIGCNAFVMDGANAPPASGWPLTIIAETTQKAAN